MIIVMKENSTTENLAEVVTAAKKQGFIPQINEGKQITIGLINVPQNFPEDFFNNLAGVKLAQHVNLTYKLTSRIFHPQDTIIQIKDVTIGGGTFTTMAGPCSVESYDQIMATAETVKKAGGQILRGGAYKPRTSPYAFQGLEEEGLELLKQAADAFDLLVVTEVMDQEHLDVVGQYTDIFQIGARNMQNFSLLKAVGKLNRPTVLKRGMAATIDEWLNAAEYLTTSGNQQVMFMERGIRTFETQTRNTLDVAAIPLMKKLTHFPVLIDPAHGTGRFDLVAPMAMAGMACGSDGLMVEVHPNPAEALSDGPQSLNFKHFNDMMQQLDYLKNALAKGDANGN
ncbi:3-deoxy-7-phosphoheptulonate synthase [Enterococcus timonensis]|uniref:3-deoxy-7-phosphoheptulonate synthase n=1 Tax=Enterococcus timonensis TaxID=1852364 RepID=UPI0008D9274B|nr:3-deoxy-7-phosphoheptulonate synthase [Enterococcus timonensis]